MFPASRKWSGFAEASVLSRATPNYKSRLEDSTYRTPSAQVNHRSSLWTRSHGPPSLGLHRLMALTQAPALTAQSTIGNRSHPPNLAFLREPKFVIIFHDLLQFASLLNTSSSNPLHYAPILRDTEYQNLICSIQYRLLQLQDKLSTILDESIRFAMLAFLTTTFQVAGQRAVYSHLARRFREFCRATNAEVPAEVVLWLLNVGGMAVFHVDGEDAEWVAELWRARIPAEWNWHEAHKRLQEFSWIKVLHDRAGRTVFETLCRKARESDEETDE